MSERYYKISPGDKVRSHYGITSGKVGVVIKVYNNPPSIDVGFDPKDPALSDFMIGKSGKVNFRLAPGEFEPVNKTTHSMPTKPHDPRLN